MATDKVVVDIVTNTDKSTSSMKKFAIGIGVATVAVGALVKVGKELVDAYAVQEQAEARLEATIKSTGSAAGLTKDELVKMATSLQGVTKYGDEAVIGAESLLLTFKNIGGDVFPRALESILDVSEAMGTGLKESSVQLGKALNDPVGGISALTRVGIQFTDEQKNTIKSMVEMNDIAGAQGIILEELESQFGGVARASGDTATGAMIQLNNAYGDTKELLGGVIAEGLQPYVQELKREIESVNNSIKAHFLRGKAVRGEATAIEELTLREMEQAKTESHLNQAQTNLALAEERLAEAVASTDLRQKQRITGLTKGIALAKDTVTGLQDELTLRKLSTETAQNQFDSEQSLLDVKLATFEAIKESNEEQTENNDLKGDEVELNKELYATEESNALMIMEYSDQRQIATSRAMNGLDDQIEKVEELEMSYQKLAESGLGSFVSAFKEVGEGNRTLMEGLKDGAKDAISSMLEMYAQLWLAQSIASFASLNFVSGAGYLLASASAMTASGFVQSFATGGSMIADQPQLIQVGEGAGSEKVTVEQSSGSSGGNQNMTLNIDGQQFTGWMQNKLDNGGLRVPRRVIV